MKNMLRRLIEQTLKRASSAVAVLAQLRSGARSRAARADIEDAIREMRLIIARLRQMLRRNGRHSPAGVCAIVARIADVIVEVLRRYPPQA